MSESVLPLKGLVDRQNHPLHQQPQICACLAHVYQICIAQYSQEDGTLQFLNYLPVHISSFVSSVIQWASSDVTARVTMRLRMLTLTVPFSCQDLQ